MLSTGQFRTEYSRSGKPKKAYPTKEAAQAVADLHGQKYGTVAAPYFSHQTGMWHVTTDRAATADKKITDQIRSKAAVFEPIEASDVRTGEIRHTGTGVSVIHKLAGMRPEHPRHQDWVEWATRANRNRGVI